MGKASALSKEMSISSLSWKHLLLFKTVSKTIVFKVFFKLAGFSLIQVFESI